MSIMIWGHRGHRRHRFSDMYDGGQSYENSMRSYEQTLETCMGLECDIIQSNEATIFLAHDTLFDGIVHYEFQIHLDEASKKLLGNRYIYQLPDEEAQKLTLKDGQKVPQLRSLLQVMKKYPGRILNLELKGPHTVDIAVRVVERAIQDKWITPEQIVFTSFNLPGLRDLRSKIGRRFKLGAIFALEELNISPMYPNWLNAPQDAYYIPFKLEDNVLDREDVRQIDPDFISIGMSSARQETVDALAEKFPKAKLIIWTANEQHPNESTYVVDKIVPIANSGKIYAVMSDFPHEMQEHLMRAGVKVKTP